MYSSRVIVSSVTSAAATSPRPTLAAASRTACQYNIQHSNPDKSSKMQYTICNNFVEQNISRLSEQDGDVKGTFKNGPANQRFYLEFYLTPWYEYDVNDSFIIISRCGGNQRTKYLIEPLYYELERIKLTGQT